jgi:hypothetical protein
MRRPVVALLCLAFALPLAADEIQGLTRLGVVNVSAAELMKQFEAAGREAAVRSLKPSPDVVLEGAEPAFIFPVVGTAGAFRTEGVLVNRRNQTQRFLAFYWPIGAGSSNCNIPPLAFNITSNTKVLLTDFVGELFSASGFGSVIVLGVNSANQADVNAALDGNARIWSLASGGGTASQNFPSMSIQVPNGQQSAFGLRSDEFYRTNWGIFNYDTRDRIFDILFSGFRGSPTQITETIPACSLRQIPVVGGPYGSLEIVFSPRDGGGLFFAYGSSVDNTSFDAWSVPARK